MNQWTNTDANSHGHVTFHGSARVCSTHGRPTATFDLSAFYLVNQCNAIALESYGTQSLRRRAVDVKIGWPHGTTS
jgi:hypothetical protein